MAYEQRIRKLTVFAELGTSKGCSLLLPMEWEERRVTEQMKPNSSQICTTIGHGGMAKSCTKGNSGWK